ncbi:MAG: TetR/AcrR family transcriptional regulator [Alloprevotella sp.]
MSTQQENTSQRILKAAEGEFMSKGFAGAKTVEIARKAGVTHAMLHYYYRTKEMLFNQVLDDKIRSLAESVVQAMQTPGRTFQERLAEGIARHFDFLAANPALARFVVNEVISKPERLELAQRNLGGVLRIIVGHSQQEMNELAARGEIAPMHIEDLLIDLMSLNAFVFIAYPAMEPFVLREGETREDFLKRRKQENIEVILRRIKP